jgi:hypothetical protein
MTQVVGLTVSNDPRADEEIERQIVNPSCEQESINTEEGLNLR